jgi:hypothetical protein
MSVLIFFGGLLVGFLSGWICMVLLTMASKRNHEADLADGLVYCRIGPDQDKCPGN